MKQALYGHPDAGGYWERHCEEGLKKAGFVPMGDCNEWRSCYFNPKTKVLMIVYVDDVKAAGPTARVKRTWADLREKREV